MKDERKFYDKDLVTFLNEKIEHHKEQMKFHRQQMEETRAQLTLITKGTTQTEVERDNIITHPDSEFSLSNWRPKVFNALESANEDYTSEDILKAIDARLSSDKELRKKAIGVISNSLQSLMKDGKVIKFDNEGRGNKYRIRKATDVAEAS